MTALKEYARLEATGLWRPSQEVQRRDVIVSLGDATLTISDNADRALAHWSLAAVARLNPGEVPAIFHPEGDASETLELGADEAEMIAAIERLQQVIERRRPHPGRLRLVLLAASVATVAALGAFWLPGALVTHTVKVVPDVKRAEIGQALVTRLTRVAGQPCTEPQANAVLARLGQRLFGDGAPRVLVMRAGPATTIHLPGRILLMNRALVEDFEEPDVAAGYLVAERLRHEARDPLERLLSEAGTLATFQLLTTGDIGEDVLDAYAESILLASQDPVADDALLSAFGARRLRATPYAYAVDITGESTLRLIEGDPFADSPPPPLLSDGDWIRLQGICGG